MNAIRVAFFLCTCIPCLSQAQTGMLSPARVGVERYLRVTKLQPGKHKVEAILTVRTNAPTGFVKISETLKGASAITPGGKSAPEVALRKTDTSLTWIFPQVNQTSALYYSFMVTDSAYITNAVVIEQNETGVLAHAARDTVLKFQQQVAMVVVHNHKQPLTQDTKTVVKEENSIKPVLDKPVHVTTDKQPLTLYSDVAVNENNDVKPVLDKRVHVTSDKQPVTQYNDVTVNESNDVKPVLDKREEIKTKPAVNTIVTENIENTRPAAHNCTYRIQISASVNNQNMQALRKRLPAGTDIHEEKIDQWYKYTTGCYTNPAEASKQMAVLQNAGFKKPFMVKYENGERVK